MHILRVRRWVTWWIYVGLICGTIAVVNILGHNLTHAQDRTLIILGIAHWLLGGIVCWVFEGVQFTPPIRRKEESADAVAVREWRPVADLLLRGSRRNPIIWRP